MECSQTAKSKQQMMNILVIQVHNCLSFFFICFPKFESISLLLMIFFLTSHQFQKVEFSSCSFQAFQNLVCRLQGNIISPPMTTVEYSDIDKLLSFTSFFRYKTSNIFDGHSIWFCVIHNFLLQNFSFLRVTYHII